MIFSFYQVVNYNSKLVSQIIKCFRYFLVLVTLENEPPGRHWSVCCGVWDRSSGIYRASYLVLVLCYSQHS